MATESVADRMKTMAATIDSVSKTIDGLTVDYATDLHVCAVTNVCSELLDRLNSELGDLAGEVSRMEGN